MNLFQNLGTTEWLIIMFVLLTLFGKKKLMEWAKGLGESGREMQKVKKEFEGTLNTDIPAPSTPTKMNKSKKKKGA